MNTQELQKARALVTDLSGKREEVINFIAKSIKGNTALEKAVADLALINRSLSKASSAVFRLQKAAQSCSLRKAKGSDEDGDIEVEIKSIVRANKEINDDVIQDLADKYGMDFEDVEDIVAGYIEKALRFQDLRKASQYRACLTKAKAQLESEIDEAIIAGKEFTDAYVKQLAEKFDMDVDDIEDAIAAAIEANGGD